MNEKIYDPTGCVPLDMVKKMTDKKMIALTNEEIKDMFTALWEAVEKQNETAYTFAEYCKGFEHLCAGVLKLKNYSGEVGSAYLVGIDEVFQKIKGMI